MHSKRNTLVAALACAMTLCAAVAVRTAAPATAAQTQSDQTRLFKTTLINLEHPSGAFDGTLQLTIGPAGTIVGYFRSADSGNFVNVTGGLSGDKIHLEIGNLPPITGSYRHGTIVGYVFLDEYTHRFTATSTDEPQT